jgi:hypothetical protein
MMRSEREMATRIGTIFTGHGRLAFYEKGVLLVWMSALNVGKHKSIR